MDERTRALIERTTQTVERIDRLRSERRMRIALRRKAPPMSERALRRLARNRVRSSMPDCVKQIIDG